MKPYHKNQAKMEASSKLDNVSYESLFFNQLEQVQMYHRLEAHNEFRIRWTNVQLAESFANLVQP
jgi:uncharacterized SAM-dependent methyltransferase